jgi:Spy/CpxP family protein refolding chaperone
MFLPFAISAQDRQQERKDKMETMHIAYLSQKLELTSAEAEKFWPIYNQYKAAKDELRKQRMDNVQAVKKAGGVDNMSEADAQKLIADETDLESRELELRKEYVTKFQQVLSVRKVAKFFIAEDEFKRYLLNELRKRREQNGRGMDDDDMGPR